MKNIFFILFLNLIMIPATCQVNIFGSHGLIKTPDAYTITNGEGVLNYAYFDDYLARHNKTKTIFSTISLAAALHTRFEAGIRLVTYPEYGGNNHDRNINFKWVLFTEKKKLPQMAIGSHDLIGTKRFHAEYIVLSKSLSIFHNHITFIPTIGYAVKWIENITGDEANDHRLDGLFGGVHLNYHDKIFLLADHDGVYSNVALGARFFKYLYTTVYINDKSYFGFKTGIQLAL